jgi:hypothetical protein
MKVYIANLPEKKKQISLFFAQPSFLTQRLQLPGLQSTAIVNDKKEFELILTALHAILIDPSTIDQISRADRKEIKNLKNLLIYNVSWEDMPDREIKMKVTL